jgi:hypothetical protein
VLAQLKGLNVSQAVAQRLIQNRAYTPADLLVISRSLARLRAGNSGLLVAKASGAATREEAVFQRRRVELLAGSAKSLGIGAFVDVGGLPLNRLKDGRLLALFPLDEVAWTERVAGIVTRATEAAKNEAAPPVLAITGNLTPLAQQEISKLGWTVTRIR